MGRVSLALIAILILVAPAMALAQPYVEGQVRAALHFGQRPDGVPRPIIGGQRTAPVTLVLDRAVTAADLTALEAIPGVWLRRVEGRPLYRGRLVPAMVSALGLARLERRGGIARIAAGVGPGPVPPLDHTTGLVGVEAARRTWVGDHWLSGQGVVLADIDSSIDVFHPDFFAADGGAYDWIDANGDGELTPGEDAIDLNRDGEAGPEETARVLMAQAWDLSTVSPLPVRPSGFSPGHDWVYADTDGDRRRDFGPNGGYDDATPAFGEPLFVADDIDGDGRLGPGERLLRLSSSRIRAVFLSYPETGAVRVYRRGEDLTELPDAPFGAGAYGLPEAAHATGVASIAAGGVAGLGRPWTGLAPDAELLVVYNGTWDMVGALVWALDEGAQVVLHEYAPWAGVTLDGTDALSELIDESTADDGVIHVCPVGNTGGARKHTMATLAPGEAVELGFRVPGWMGVQYLGLSLHVRPGDADVGVVVTAPSGERYELNDERGGFRLEGMPAWATWERSRGGTNMLHLQATGDVPTEGWSVEVTGDAEAEVSIHGYVQDEISGWGEGIAWDRGIATDASTVGLPSTAASCLAVGAYTGHTGERGAWWFAGEERAGEIRGYSGRGPRIDGWLKPDLAAPDNPFAAFPRWSDYEIDLGSYWVFGGTSGAGPHLAGAALLLRQRFPEGGGEVIDRLLSGAAADRLTGEVPNPDYGYGRVDLWAPLELERGAAPPVLRLEAPARGAPGATVAVVPVVEDLGGTPEEAEVRWDEGYDGAWDGGFGAVAELSVVLPEEEGRYPVRAEVRAGSGLTDRAVVWIEVELDGGGDGDADADVDSDGDLDAEGEGDWDADQRRLYRARGGTWGCSVTRSAGGSRGEAGWIRRIPGTFLGGFSL